MKRIFLLVLLLVTFIGILIALRGNEDEWICNNGLWVKHGNPSTEMPTGNCR